MNNYCYVEKKRVLSLRNENQLSVFILCLA